MADTGGERGMPAVSKSLRFILWVFLGGVLVVAQPQPEAGQAPRPLLQRIQQALGSGREAVARKQLSDALETYPRDPVLHSFLGVLEAQQNHYRAAETSFRKAIELGPDYAAAYLNLGRLYQQQGARDPQAVQKGIAVYRKLLELDPASAEAHYQIALLYSIQGASRKALAHLDRLPPDVQRQSKTLTIRCAAQADLHETAKVERCVQDLSKSSDLDEVEVLPLLAPLAAADEDDMAVLLLETLSERRLASPETLGLLAALYEKQDKLTEARGVYEALVADNGPTLPRLLGLARVAYRQKDFEGTLGYLAHARDLDPKNSGVHFFFGMVCVEMDLVVEAERSLRTAVELNPDNPYYNYALGAVIANGKKWEEAIPYFEKYCAGEPDDPRGKLALASAHFHNYQTKLASKELEQLVNNPSTAAGARYQLGLVAIRQGDFQRAASELEQAVRLKQDYAEAYAELGFAYLQLDRLDEARTALESSLKLQPDGRRANMTLLTYFRKAGDPRAKEQAKRFAEINKRRSQRAKLLLRTIEARPY